MDLTVADGLPLGGRHWHSSARLWLEAGLAAKLHSADPPPLACTIKLEGLRFSDQPRLRGFAAGGSGLTQLDAKQHARRLATGTKCGDAPAVAPAIAASAVPVPTSPHPSETSLLATEVLQHLQTGGTAALLRSSTVAFVGSGMRVVRRSSFTIAVCVLPLFSLTVVRGNSPPGWGLPSILACTVMNPVLTPHNISDTVRPSGRPFFLHCTVGFSSAQIDQQMEEAFGPHLLSLQYKRPVDSDQSAASREAKTAKGVEGKGSGSAQDAKGKGRLRAAAAAVAIRARTTPGAPGWGSGSGFWNQQQTQSRQQDQDFIPDAQMCRLMAKAIVDQADTIAVLRQSTAWVMWMQTRAIGCTSVGTGRPELWSPTRTESY